MPSVVYEIDPFADTIIILKNRCNIFAPWDETPASSYNKIAEPEEEHLTYFQFSEDEWTNKKLSKKKTARMRSEASHNTTGPGVPEGNGERADPSDGELSGKQELWQIPALATSAVSGIKDLTVEPTELDSEPTKLENDEIHYFVSSRHLMLASPWFRRVLSSQKSTEALKDPSDERYHILASDWDEEALLILLNIFHIRTRKVPATVSLEMLAKIAVLVDYYELESAEVLERDTRDWIANLRRSIKIPSSYCRDLMLWICISRVFRMSEEFEKSTAVAITDSHEYIQTLNLPIPERIISNIDRSRCKALEYIISELHRLLEVYRDFNYSCPTDRPYSFQCGAFLFGALTKYMESWGYLSPRPEKPFLGMSLNQVCNTNNIANNMKWWHQRPQFGAYGGYGGQFYPHSCDLSVKINEVVQSAKVKVKGLKL